MLWPAGSPLWLAIAGNISCTVIIGCLTVLLLPKDLVSKIWIAKKVRSKITKSFKRMAKLSTQGPFYRLFQWCGRKGACGKLSSKCQQPQSVKLSAIGRHDATLAWNPKLPVNPFHEETYVCAWKRADAGEGSSWHTKELSAHDMESEKEGKRLRVNIPELPEETRILARVCAKGSWGRGPWSEEVACTTLVEPNKGGGFEGPLGPAASGHKIGKYTWAQTKDELTLKVPIPSGWKAKDLSFKTLPSRLELLYVGGAAGEPRDVLSGALYSKVLADDVIWEIGDDDDLGRCFMVELQKAEKVEKWAALMSDARHHRIDVKALSWFAEGGAGGGGVSSMSPMSNGGLDIWE